MEFLYYYHYYRHLYFKLLLLRKGTTFFVKAHLSFFARRVAIAGQSVSIRARPGNKKSQRSEATPTPTGLPVPVGCVPVCVCGYACVCMKSCQKCVNKIKVTFDVVVVVFVFFNWVMAAVNTRAAQQP